MSQSRKSRSPVTIELTRRALSDLRAIEEYSTSEWSQKIAGRYLAEIEGALDRLRCNPDLLRLEPEFAPSLYFYRVRRHYLVCDYQDRSVIVLAVVHTSMDIPARLQELEPRLIAELELVRKQARTEPPLR